MVCIRSSSSSNVSSGMLSPLADISFNSVEMYKDSIGTSSETAGVICRSEVLEGDIAKMAIESIFGVSVPIRPPASDKTDPQYTFKKRYISPTKQESAYPSVLERIDTKNKRTEYVIEVRCCFKNKSLPEKSEAYDLNIISNVNKIIDYQCAVNIKRLIYNYISKHLDHFDMTISDVHNWTFKDKFRVSSINTYENIEISSFCRALNYADITYRCKLNVSGYIALDKYHLRCESLPLLERNVSGISQIINTLFPHTRSTDQIPMYKMLEGFGSERVLQRYADMSHMGSRHAPNVYEVIFPATTEGGVEDRGYILQVILPYDHKDKTFDLRALEDTGGILGKEHAHSVVQCMVSYICWDWTPFCIASEYKTPNLLHLYKMMHSAVTWGDFYKDTLYTRSICAVMKNSHQYDSEHVRSHMDKNTHDIFMEFKPYYTEVVLNDHKISLYGKVKHKHE